MAGAGECPSLSRFVRPVSSGERAVALLVIELGEQDTGASLGDLLSSLNPANARAFYRATQILTDGA